MMITFELFLKESGVQKALMMSFTSAFTYISLTFDKLHCRRTLTVHATISTKVSEQLSYSACHASQQLEQIRMYAACMQPAALVCMQADVETCHEAVQACSGERQCAF